MNENKPKKEPIGYLFGYPIYTTEKVLSIEEDTLEIKAPTPQSLLSPSATVGEQLADWGYYLLYPRDNLVIAEEDITPEQISKAKLAMDFVKRGPAFVFLAIMENWDLAQIVRELY